MVWVLNGDGRAAHVVLRSWRVGHDAGAGSRAETAVVRARFRVCGSVECGSGGSAGSARWAVAILIDVEMSAYRDVCGRGGSGGVTGGHWFDVWGRSWPSVSEKAGVVFLNIYIVACADGFASLGTITRVRRVPRSGGVY